MFELSQLANLEPHLKNLLVSLAVIACCAFAAAPAMAASFLGDLPAAVDAGQVLLASGLVAAGVASAPRKLEVGDAVCFHVGINDNVFSAGSRLDGEITHVWNDTCVNIAVTDADGHLHTRTSVLIVHPGSSEPAGYFATLKEAVAETG